MRPILFYTVGYPGAGKTTLARGLAALLQTEHLRGDQIGLQLFRFPTFSPEERRMVFAEMNQRASDHLRAGRHAVYDAANNTATQRAALHQLAEKHGASAIGLWIEVATPLAKKRAGTPRDAGIVGGVVRTIPPQLFDQYVANFEAPLPHEAVVHLSGDARFWLQYRRLQRQLAAHQLRLPHLV